MCSALTVGAVALSGCPATADPSLTPSTASRQVIGSCTYTEVVDATLFIPDVERIDVATVSPNATIDVTKEHVIMRGDADRDLLHVHLNGSGGGPNSSTNIVTAGAFAGFHAIGLAYPSDVSIDDSCKEPDGSDAPDDCEEGVREETVYGGHAPADSAYIDISTADSIVKRLSDVLSDLDSRHPTGGWAQFLESTGEPVWSKIMFTGFSQGGGHAGILARDHDLARVIFLSKGVGAVDGGGAIPARSSLCTFPVDPLPADLVPAPWYLDARATSGDKSFALVHTCENAFSYSPVAWEEWGLGTTFANADTDLPPFGCSHLLHTSLTPAQTPLKKRVHKSIGNNGAQPKDAAGTPEMFDTWVYMMTADL